MEQDWRSEDHWWRSILSFYPLGHGGQTHVIRLVSKDLPLLSHLTVTHQSCLIDRETGLGSLNDLPKVHELKNDGVGDFFSPFNSVFSKPWED